MPLGRAAGTIPLVGGASTADEVMAWLALGAMVGHGLKLGNGVRQSQSRANAHGERGEGN